MPSSRVFHAILVVSSCAHISTQHLVATRRSRSRPAQRHTSTIISCSSAQKVSTPTRSSMRSAVTAQCVVERVLKSLFRGVGRWSASSRRWLKDKTCACELGVCCPYFDVSPARSRSLRCRRQSSKFISRPRRSLRRRHARIWRRGYRSSFQMEGM